jgi:hypothetical protein
MTSFSGMDNTAMIKVLLRTLIILMVTGLVAGGIYLWAENGSAGLLGGDSLPGGADFADGARPARPDGADFGRREGGREGGMGFSLAGLAGVAVQLGKIAAITTAVLVVRALARLVGRRPRPDSASEGVIQVE